MENVLGAIALFRGGKFINLDQIGFAYKNSEKLVEQHFYYVVITFLGNWPLGQEGDTFIWKVLMPNFQGATNI